MSELELSSRINYEIHEQQNRANARVKFSPKKCWICLSIFELEDKEYNLIQKQFLNKNLDFVINQNEITNRTDKIRLIILMNKFVLTVCNCRKKLAHLNCFNDYIDLKQNGNINIDIYCSQCNFKYEFNYPYNGPILQFFDLFDQIVYCSSSLMTISLCISSAYWSCLTYSVLTVFQVYGYENGFNLLSKSNNFLIFGVLPALPVLLVSSRFIPWQDYIYKLFPTYSIVDLNRKLSENDQMIEDEDEKEDAKFMSKIRLVVGGLLLPTIAVSLDRLILNRFDLIKSTVLRTTITGAIFIGVKGMLKILCLKQKMWQQINRDIKNYNSFE